MATDQDLIPVVQRSYDLCAGLYEHVNRFPRAQRTLLGRVILDDALRMLVSLTVANRRRELSVTTNVEIPVVARGNMRPIPFTTDGTDFTDTTKEPSLYP